jgi:hypothetical protein
LCQEKGELKKQAPTTSTSLERASAPLQEAKKWGDGETAKLRGVHVREWGRSTFNLLKQLLDLVLAPVAVYVHPQHMVLQRAGKAKTQEQLRQLSLTKPHVDMRKGERRGEEREKGTWILTSLNSSSLVILPGES